MEMELWAEETAWEYKCHFDIVIAMVGSPSLPKSPLSPPFAKGGWGI